MHGVGAGASRARTVRRRSDGQDGLLTSMVRDALQAELYVEMAEHLGYEPYDAAGRNSGPAATVTTGDVYDWCAPAADHASAVWIYFPQMPSSDHDPGSAMPKVLGEIVDMVLLDFQQDSPIEICLSFEGPGTLWVSEASDPRRSGFRPVSEQRVDLLIEFATWLQDQFFPETRQAWGQSRPACPGHPHPAQAVRIGDDAWWICPIDRHQISPIGKYGVGAT